MAGIEGTGVDGIGENVVGGRPQAPTVHLRRTAEVTPIGVVICAAGNPQHWGHLWYGVTGTEGHLYSSPLTGPWRGNTGERIHPPARETGRSCPPGLDKNGP